MKKFFTVIIVVVMLVSITVPAQAAGKKSALKVQLWHSIDSTESCENSMKVIPGRVYTIKLEIRNPGRRAVSSVKMSSYIPEAIKAHGVAQIKINIKSKGGRDIVKKLKLRNMRNCDLNVSYVKGSARIVCKHGTASGVEKPVVINGVSYEDINDGNWYCTNRISDKIADRQGAKLWGNCSCWGRYSGDIFPTDQSAGCYEVYYKIKVSKK